MSDDKQAVRLSNNDRYMLSIQQRFTIVLTFRFKGSPPLDQFQTQLQGVRTHTTAHSDDKPRRCFPRCAERKKTDLY